MAAALGCSQSPQATTGTQVKMDFARASLWDAPFPSDELRQAGRVTLPGFDAHGNDLVTTIVELAERTKGFATSAGVFFTFTGPIETTALPDLKGSIGDDSPVRLVEIFGPTAGRRIPLESSFSARRRHVWRSRTSSPCCRCRAFPWSPNATYAAVVLRKSGRRERCAAGCLGHAGVVALGARARRPRRRDRADVPAGAGRDREGRNLSGLHRRSCRVHDAGSHRRHGRVSRGDPLSTCAAARCAVDADRYVR